jgi:hypothetical protein
MSTMTPRVVAGRMRRWVMLSAMTVALAMIPAGAAQASCMTDAIGIASSGGVAAVAATQACAPAWGEPAGRDTGRRVG